MDLIVQQKYVELFYFVIWLQYTMLYAHGLLQSLVLVSTFPNVDFRIEYGVFSQEIIFFKANVNI